MQELIGRRLAHYDVRERLGFGGMGQVYSAEDTKLGREVALKVLPPDMGEDTERLQRFEREARTVASLNHPNIVTVHSIEESDGLRFLTMELVRGQTLRHLVPDSGLPLDRFFALAIPVVDAIGAAHERGITHRDLKPENIMVTHEGRVKVLDFGLAKPRVTAFAEGAVNKDAETMTRDGRILGTVAYMSPEQAQGQAVDHRSDIFSLGILLYEMATGQRPFRGATSLSILSSILKDTPAAVTDLKASLPRPLARMIQRALEKVPADRYQSAFDLRKDIEDLKRDIESGEVRGARAELATEPMAIHRQRWPRVAIAGLVVAAAGLLVIPRWRPRAVEPPSVALPQPPAPPAAPAAAVMTNAPSLAIFYFENLSGDPSLDWLRTGLTDMLVTDLSQSTGLRVLSTAALRQILIDTGRLKEQSLSLDVIREVARQGQASKALVGSFVKAGSQLRISARLQDALSGEVMSAERVEGQDATIFQMVDELTRRIKARLAVQATASAGERELRDVSTADVEAYRHYAEGFRLHEDGNDPAALSHLEQAVARDPKFATALAKLAIVHGNLGSHTKAREFARRAVENADRLSGRERYYIEGVYNSMSPETLEQSMEAYRKAIEAYPDHHAARNNLAQHLMKFGRYEEALGHLEKLRDDKMPFPGTYETLAEARAAMGDLEGGLVDLRRFVLERPGNATGLSQLAGQLIALGKLDEAATVLDRAQAIDGDNFQALSTRWALLVLSGRYDAAPAVSERLKRSAQPFAGWMATVEEAMLNAYRGKTRLAVAAFENAAKRGRALGEFGAESHIVAADLLTVVGDTKGALEQVRKALSMSHERAETLSTAHGLEAVLLALSGDAAASQKAFENAEAAIAGVPEPLKAGGRLEFEGHLALARGDHAEAIAKLNAAFEKGPKRTVGMKDASLARTWYALGLAHKGAGRDEEARAWFEKIASAYSERLFVPWRYARALYYLGQIAELRGEHQLARGYYERYRSLWKDGDVDRPQIAEVARKLATAEAR